MDLRSQHCYQWSICSKCPCNVCCLCMPSCAFLERRVISLFDSAPWCRSTLAETDLRVRNESSEFCFQTGDLGQDQTQEAEAREKCNQEAWGARQDFDQEARDARQDFIKEATLAHIEKNRTSASAVLSCRRGRGSRVWLWAFVWFGGFGSVAGSCGHYTARRAAPGATLP